MPLPLCPGSGRAHLAQHAAGLAGELGLAEVQIEEG